MNWPYPKILAHRGGGTLAPENTLAGIRCGLEHDFHAIEFDVMLTADGVPILMHDDELGRTVAGSGSISAIPSAQLLTKDAGSWLAPQFADARVPTFADVIAFCKAHRIWMNVEIKPVPGFERKTGKAAAMLAQQLFADEIASNQGPQTLPLFSSFSFEALQAAQQQAPEIPRGFLLDRVPSDWQAMLEELEAVALHTNHKHLTAQLAADVRAAGYGLLCYTVNDVERAREILGWGVNAFCTDRIDLIGPDFS
jgi:glycerophosphoryl diester phosphodiesterase